MKKISKNRTRRRGGSRLSRLLSPFNIVRKISEYYREKHHGLQRGTLRKKRHERDKLIKEHPELKGKIF
jgi:hypothetical protein